MRRTPFNAGIGRRAVLKTGLLLSAAQVTSPFVISALGEDTIKIGLDNPLTGTYAAVGKNEKIGCELAVEQINDKGGILGRKVELLVEDSTSGDAGTAVQKARKLIDRDQVNFLLSNVNSALALATAGVSFEKGVLHIVPGGHTDAITGATCHWNVFRVCNPTQTEANSVTPSLIKNAGKKWYYITPDYAFGHTLQAGLEKACDKNGGTKIGADLTPLGTTDFSSYLIKAQSANPDVIVILVQGDDMINCMKQAVQFGLDKKVHLAGAQQELEALSGLPPEARVGTWVFEWYWKQPGVEHVADFNATIKKRSNGMPTARTWFGFVSTWSCALAANTAKTLEPQKMAKALEGMHLPPEVALTKNGAYYRAGDHQLIADLFVGNAQAGDAATEDYFNVSEVVKGDDISPTLEETGCKMAFPA
jgi:branched-chain amino acid transport system substrate-binding protein